MDPQMRRIQRLHYRFSATNPEGCFGEIPKKYGKPEHKPNYHPSPPPSMREEMAEMQREGVEINTDTIKELGQKYGLSENLIYSVNSMITFRFRGSTGTDLRIIFQRFFGGGHGVATENCLLYP